jgi:glycosyltransferase involved in cell wall biosynthesis
MIELSILICSTHTRWRTFGRAIQEQVWEQYDALPADDQRRVEILMLTDNKQMTVGDKRNTLVGAAQGRYVAFVDDDDRIEADYLAALLAATGSGADVITFWAAVTINGGPVKLCHYGLEFDRDRNTALRYERLPNHICAVLREVALRLRFPSTSYGEDAVYARALKAFLLSEQHIPRVLYHYDYSDATTETQKR